jgi:hypothetical protein
MLALQKFQALGCSVDEILQCGARYLRALGVELASLHPAGVIVLMYRRLIWKCEHTVNLCVFSRISGQELWFYYTTLTLPRIARRRRLPSSCLSVYLPVYHSGFHWTDFREILCWGLTWKSSEELQIWVESYKNFGQFTYLKTQVVLLFPTTQKAFLCNNMSIFLTVKCSSYTQMMHCCVSNVTMIMRTSLIFRFTFTSTLLLPRKRVFTARYKLKFQI